MPDQVIVTDSDRALADTILDVVMDGTDSEGYQSHDLLDKVHNLISTHMAPERAAAEKVCVEATKTVKAYGELAQLEYHDHDSNPTIEAITRYRATVGGKE